MKSLALYELSDQYLEAMDTLSRLDLDEETMAATIEGLAGDIKVKAENVAKVIRNLEASSEAIKEAERQMAHRRKVIENRAAWIRNYLLENMKRAQFTKIESPWFTLSIRKNPPKVVIDDEAALPATCWRPVAPVIDKQAIAQMLKDNEYLPGAHLERTDRLEIK